MQTSKRLNELPPYLFAEIDRKRKAAIEAGKDILNLGVGDPDQPTPDFIIEALRREAGNPKNHRYALDQGHPEFRRAIARWFEKRYGVRLDPDREILPLIGSKEGIAHLPLAVIDPGDVALVPDPGYPPYRSGSRFAGAEVVEMPLRANRGFLPDLGAIPEAVARRARLLFLNNPNNPTAALAPRAFLDEAVGFARANSCLLAGDAAYAEVYFEEKPMSLLQLEGGKEVSIEFHSLSKTFNMTGWRIGFAAGAAEAVLALGKLKTNLDSGIFSAIQLAGAAALDGYDRPEVRAINETYRRRRDALVDGLDALGWKVARPRATFYVWLPCPGGWSSTELCAFLLDELAIVTTPGIGFGKSGEGYIRMALTVSEDRIREAVRRIGSAWTKIDRDQS